MKGKCNITGKTCFSSFAEAKEKMMVIKQICRMVREGKRIKHRMGKPVQRRVYYCAYCNGYHLTRLTFFSGPFTFPGLPFAKANGISYCS